MDDDYGDSGDPGVKGDVGDGDVGFGRGVDGIEDVDDDKVKRMMITMSAIPLLMSMTLPMEMVVLMTIFVG